MRTSHCVTVESLGEEDEDDDEVTGRCLWSEDIQRVVRSYGVVAPLTRSELLRKP